MSNQGSCNATFHKKIKVEKEDFEKMYSKLDPNHLKPIHNNRVKNDILSVIEEYLNQESPSEVMNYLKNKYNKPNTIIANDGNVKRNRIDNLFKQKTADFREGNNKISPVDINKIVCAYSVGYIDPKDGLMDVNQEEISRLLYSVYPKMRLIEQINDFYDLNIYDFSIIEEFCKRYLIKNSVPITTKRGKHPRQI